MKSLAGANPDAKPDYRTQALSDLNKLEQKVVLLNEMLDNVDAEKREKFVSGDAYDVIIFCHLLLMKGWMLMGFFFVASINDLGSSTTKTTKVDFGCSN